MESIPPERRLHQRELAGSKPLHISTGSGPWIRCRAGPAPHEPAFADPPACNNTVSRPPATLVEAPAIPRSGIAKRPRQRSPLASDREGHPAAERGAFARVGDSIRVGPAPPEPAFADPLACNNTVSRPPTTLVEAPAIPRSGIARRPRQRSPLASDREGHPAAERDAGRGTRDSAQRNRQATAPAVAARLRSRRTSHSRRWSPRSGC